MMFRRTTRREPRAPRGYSPAGPLMVGGRVVGLHAVEDASGRPVLIFVATTPEEIDRFRHLSSVLPRHPGLAEAHDGGRMPRGRLYVASACPGPSLGGAAAVEPLPADKAVAIVTRVAEALCAVHAAGTVHGDVRPEYVLYDGETPVLTGFWSPLPALNRMPGETVSPADAFAYMAPELIEGSEPSVAADVYALAATLYALLAGRSAHSAAAAGGGTAALLQAKLYGALPDIVRPDVSLALAAALARAMAPEPTERFASVTDFALALGGGAAVPVTARRPSDGAERTPAGAGGPVVATTRSRAPGRPSIPTAPQGATNSSATGQPRNAASASLFAPDDDNGVLVTSVIDGTMTGDPEVVTSPRSAPGMVTRTPDEHSLAHAAQRSAPGTYDAPVSDQQPRGTQLVDSRADDPEGKGLDGADSHPAGRDVNGAGADRADDETTRGIPVPEEPPDASAPGAASPDRGVPITSAVGTRWADATYAADGGPPVPPAGNAPSAGESRPAPVPGAGSPEAAASAFEVENPAERSPVQRVLLIAAAALVVIAIAGVVGLVGSGRKGQLGARHGGSSKRTAAPAGPVEPRPTVTQVARPPTKVELMRYQPAGLKAVPAPQQIVLTWRLPADGERDGAGIVIRQQPSEGGNGITALSRGPNGRLPLTYVAVPLRPGQQYCFLVGVLIQRAGGSPILAQAAPICATPR